MKISRLLSVTILATGFGFGGLSAQEASLEQKSSPAVKEVVAPDYIKGDIIYGSADAPVEIIEYGSMTCSHCASFSKEVTAFLKEELIPSGKVRLVFRNYIRDKLDMAVSVAGRCTSDIDASKDLIETYFEKQVAWMTSDDPRSVITAIAGSKGITPEDLDRCFASQEMMEHVISIAKEGHEKYEIRATPTVIMNGVKVSFSHYSDLKKQILAAVANAE